jgi:hypothetical protein
MRLLQDDAAPATISLIHQEYRDAIRQRALHHCGRGLSVAADLEDPVIGL